MIRCDTSGHVTNEGDIQTAGTYKRFARPVGTEQTLVITKSLGMLERERAAVGSAMVEARRAADQRGEGIARSLGHIVE